MMFMTTSALRNKALMLVAGLILSCVLIVVSSSIVSAYGADSGQEVYNQCIGCHSFSYNRTGPKHCGVFGRRAGVVPDFEYSQAMRESKLVWDEVTLDQFLASPLTVVPGTTMGFAGISDAGKRQQLIAYIRRQSQSNECK